MRVARTVVTIALSTALLAACGSSGSSSTDQAAPTPVAASSAPATAVAPGSAAPTDTASSTPSASAGSTISVQRATELADAGVLVAADLPGYTGAPQTHDASDDTTENAVSDCVVVPHAVYVHRNYGITYTKGPAEVDSSADVVATPAEAAREAQAFDTSKAASCYRTKLAKYLAKNGLTIDKFTVTLVHAAVTGADHTFAYHMVADLTGPGGTVNLDSYLIGAQVGQTEISISGDSTSGTANLTQVEKLAATLTARVGKT